MKKSYIKPIVSAKNIEMESMLHPITQAKMNVAAHDLYDSDVDLQGIDVNNGATGTVNFGRDRASVDWDF